MACSPNEAKPTICFVAQNAYSTLVNSNAKHAGGIEQQASLMTKWLSRHGYNISLITWDEDYSDGVKIDNVRLIKLCKESDGVKILRFFIPRWSSLVSALKRANADIYYYNCGDLALGQIALWTKLKNKKLIYSVASEADCFSSLPALNEFRERFLYKFGLRNADKIIVQTKKQQQLLKDEFSLNSTVVPMPCAGFDIKNKNPAYKYSQEKHILWVGRISEEKRLEWLFDVAKSYPEIIFDVIGDANKKSDYATKLKQQAALIPNIILHGRIPHDKLNNYFDRAFLFCSTSVYEGFPNTFLEAWSVGVPLVTFFDPDNIVASYGVGAVANDLDDLKKIILTYVSDSKSYLKSSEAASNYFNEHHAIDIAMPVFEKQFKEVVELRNNA